MPSPPCSPYWQKPGVTLRLDQAGCRNSTMLQPRTSPISTSELQAGGKMAPICAELWGFCTVRPGARGWVTDLVDHLHCLVWSSFPGELKDPPDDGEREEEVGSSLLEGDAYLPRDSPPRCSKAGLSCACSCIPA